MTFIFLIIVRIKYRDQYSIVLMDFLWVIHMTITCHIFPVSNSLFTISILVIYLVFKSPEWLIQWTGLVFLLRFSKSPSHKSFISRIWDLLELTNLWGVIFKMCTSCVSFTWYHVFVCLSIHVEVIWYSVWLTTCHSSLPLWIKLFFYDVTLISVIFSVYCCLSRLSWFIYWILNLVY